MTTTECCICMDDIMSTNCVTTPCGHIFHANCLMKHTRVNSYTCPCCRAEMVEQLVDEEEDEDEDEDDNSEDSDYDTITDEMEEERNLQGFRWLFQRVNDEALEGDEDEYIERMEEESFQSGQEKLIYEEQKEQIDHLVQEIKKKNCVSYDDLLRAYIGTNCDDYMYNEFSRDIEYKVTSTINGIDTRARNNLPPHLREHWARGVRM
jgi:hypothetical protein